MVAQRVGDRHLRVADPHVIQDVVPDVIALHDDGHVERLEHVGRTEDGHPATTELALLEREVQDDAVAEELVRGDAQLVVQARLLEPLKLPLLLPLATLGTRARHHLERVPRYLDGRGQLVLPEHEHVHVGHGAPALRVEAGQHAAAGDAAVDRQRLDQLDG